MIQLGQKVKFDALACVKQSCERSTAITTGIVVYINKRGKWFSVLYGENQRISFHYCEIGKTVQLCK